MTKPKKPTTVKLIVGLISSQESKFSKASKLLEQKYGPIDLKSSVMRFTHTNYYEKEFGSNLKRIFLSFKKLTAIKNLYKSKLDTQKIERRLSSNLKRQVNIDPGYITLGKLVLFTTKNYSHRIYLNRGIYAEVTLKFEGNSFIPWPWTYPDYKTNEYIEFFTRVREIYKAQS